MSTSAVKDNERVMSQQIETAKRRGERAVKAMEENHRNYKAELKKVQQDEIVDLQTENLKVIDQEAIKKEKVLSEMRSHLQNTQQLTDKELKGLQERGLQDRERLQNRLIQDRDKVIADSNLYLEELTDKYQVEGRKVNLEGKKQIEGMQTHMQSQYVDQQGHFQKKINDQSQEFTARFQHDAREHKRLMDQAQGQNKNERIAVNRRQQTELSKMVEAQNQQLEKRELHYRKGLKDQDVFFEQRYAESHAAKTKDANSLDDRYNELVNKMKLDLTSEMTKTTNRLDDPFYQLTELKPTLTKTEDGVEVKVAVPEYSKQDLQLTTNGKEVILNFNRRFSDAQKSPDGIMNKVNRVETYTSRLNAEMHLDPKTVKSTYDSGVMTYTIKKS